jgi:coenzyme F420-reducing hydrogenase beta subunit
MIKISKREDCCGCGACEQICSQQCISLSPDVEGFLYPIVNENICIDCHRCEKACPILNPDPTRKPLKVLAAYNRDESIREKSSSGGIFTIVAEEVLKQNGIVFGVKFDKDWNVVFDYTNSSEGLEAFRGSKYVQAFIGNAYSKVQEFLKEGMVVLFTGTPCQIAGLRKYLNKEYNNLLLMDIICEGVPSPKVWNKYLHEEIKNLSKKHYHIPEKEIVIQKISFRNKRDGWKSFAFSLNLAYKDGSQKTTPLLEYINRNSPYLQAMFRFLDLRPICYECPFKSCKSHSDITIADYWGIDTLHPEMYDNKGTSMVYIHTAKGDSFLPHKKNKIYRDQL